MFLLFVAGIVVRVTKRISAPHWNLCCRPGPNFFPKKNKKTQKENADAAEKDDKQQQKTEARLGKHTLLVRFSQVEPDS